MPFKIHRRLVETADGTKEPVIGWPYPKQQEVLGTILSRIGREEPCLVNLCCGRGFGKTTLAIDIAQMFLNMGGDQRGLFLEPDRPRMRKAFLTEWRYIVPESLYSENKGEQVITWKPNGALLYYGHRAITGSRQRTADKEKGGNLTFVIDDEAAQGFNRNQYLNTLVNVRRKNRAGVRAYITASTPAVGEYADMLADPQAVTIFGTSYDNPALDRAMIERWREMMSPAQFEREILGRVIATSGAIWQNVDLMKPWPDGNLDVLHPSFDPNMPWYLFCDIGSATGAFVIAQPDLGSFCGRDLFAGPRWVICADFCPASDANVRRVFRRLKTEYGNPAGIVGGADIQTSMSTDGRSVAYFAEQIFGAVPIYPCSERIYDKRIQYDLLDGLFCAANRTRRLTIARDFVSLDPNSRRGVREMIKEDVWLDDDKRRPQDFLPKNKEIRVQHVRDALLMGAAMIMKPPKWGVDETEYEVTA